MFTSSLGDMAQNYSLQSRNTSLKQDIQRLTQELASGQVADMRKAVTGNAAYVNDLERSLTKLDGYETATQEAVQFADSVQTALGRVYDLNSAFRDTLIMQASAPPKNGDNSLPAKATKALTDVINTVNTQSAGRSLFAGTATDTAPLASPDDLLAALGTAVAGAGSVDDILAAAQTWFDDPAGFASIGYLGSDTSLAPLAVSDRDSARFELRADDTAFRDTLRNLAMNALADDPALGLSDTQKSELAQKTLGGVIGASSAMIDLQTTVGTSQGQLETITTQNASERTSLQIARNELLAINPFEAATELEQVQFQLQSLYAITSRMSQLSLVNFL